MILDYVQDLPIDVHRTRYISELVMPELADSIAIAYSLCRISNQARFSFEDAQQILPVACRLVQSIQSRNSGEVVRIDLQNALVGIDGLGHLPQLAFINGAYFHI